MMECLPLQNGRQGFEVFSDAVENHLYRQQNEQGAHQAGKGGSAFFSQQVKQFAGYAE